MWGDGVTAVSRRTSLSEGVLKVVATVERARSSGGLTIQEITEKGGLNRRTVEKAVELLLALQERLKHQEFKLAEVGRSKLLKVESRMSRFSDLPDDLQKTVIRTLWFPRPSPEQQTIAHLYLKGATREDRAIFMNPVDATILKLARQGQIMLRRKKAYLTKEGVIVAKGTLDLYPELVQLAETLR